MMLLELRDIIQEAFNKHDPRGFCEEKECVNEYQLIAYSIASRVVSCDLRIAEAVRSGFATHYNDMVGAEKIIEEINKKLS